MFPTRYPWILASVVALITVSSGCQERPTSTTADVVNDTVVATAQRIVVANVPAAKKASLSIGDEFYEFDSITCIGTTMATAVAADRADRDGYPTVTLKTFDLSMTGGMNSNTASIQFRSTNRDELWVLHEGSVSKDGDLFRASGTVEGRRMVTQPDGTLKPQPLDSDDIKPFDVNIECS